ncbi:MAG TPA: glycine cleavage system aminomethyltransferase GcvT [bacterium]
MSEGPLARTALYERHLAFGARMTEFHGWEMPLYYTSILDEHRAVREALGVFDTSHMGQVLVTGAAATDTLNGLVVSDLARLGTGRACYTLMLNERGGILDDLIIYRLGGEEFLVIVNCGRREEDVAWMRRHAEGRADITDISAGRSMLAVQGPLASRVLEELLDAKVAGLGRFEMAPIRTMGPDASIARTGYTGGDGFELFLPDAHATRLWEAILAASAGAGGRPAGLGARDTLRLEAGLRLYGADLNDTTNPYEAGLAWTVVLDKGPFIGQDALRELHASTGRLTRRLVGFELEHGPVPRAGTPLLAGGRQVGEVTSGGYSPALARPVAMGYVETASAEPGTALAVVIRNQRHHGRVVRLPFWKAQPGRLTAAGPATKG